MVNKKQPKAAQDAGKERMTISVRNVSAEKWRALQVKARSEGRFVWAVLDELFDAYLKK